MLKIHVPKTNTYRIRYRYTEFGELRSGSAYFLTIESAEKFCARLRNNHPNAIIH